MNVFAICAFALLAVFLTVTLKQMEPRFGGMVVTAAGIVFWLFAIKELLPVVQTLVGLTQTSDFSDSFAALFRALGLALVISFCAGVCRDLGENGLAEKVEFCGKTAILALALPSLRSLLSVIASLLS